MIGETKSSLNRREEELNQAIAMTKTTSLAQYKLRPIDGPMLENLQAFSQNSLPNE